jgi:opacity protein-like surface antigen
MRKLYNLLFLLLLIFPGIITAYESFTRYIGFEAQIRRTNFRGGYGDNFLPHNLFQRNPYVGVKFNEYAGLEVGYGSTISRTRGATLTTGDVCGGVIIPPMLSPIRFISTIKIHYPHVNILAFYHFREDVPVQLLGSAGIGMSFIKGEVIRQTVSIANRPVYWVRTFSSHKNVLRLGGGVQYLFTPSLGLRGTFFWENTHRFVMVPNDHVPSLFVPIIKTKKTILYGLGMFIGW